MTDVVTALRNTWVSLGARPSAITTVLPPTTAHFDGRQFRNAQPDIAQPAGRMTDAVRAMLTRRGSGKPVRPIDVVRPQFPPAARDLVATWLGHASVLMELHGTRILADPMFSLRASPADFLGPRRLHPSPVTVVDLPQLDAIVISHDHYDHLDLATIRELQTCHHAPFVVPLGIGAHLRAWGVASSRIVELQWGESITVGEVTVTCTPARHFSGRTVRRNPTLWSSWALVGPRHRVFFGGDTGYTTAFADIGREHGPFDLTLLPIGAYADAWADIHMTPEQALRAHRDLRGRMLLPIHWATFDLAPHPWAEPMERLLRSELDDDVLLALPRPGQSVDATSTPPLTHWWR